MPHAHTFANFSCFGALSLAQFIQETQTRDSTESDDIDNISVRGCYMKCAAQFRGLGALYMIASASQRFRGPLPNGQCLVEG